MTNMTRLNLLLRCIFISLFFTSIVHSQSGDIPVFVDNEPVHQLSAKQITDQLNLSRYSDNSLPSVAHWYSVVIKGKAGTDLSFQDWQRHYRGKEIRLFISGNKQQAALFNAGRNKALFQIEDVHSVFITTIANAEKQAATNKPLEMQFPALTLVKDNQPLLVEARHLGQADTFGWQLNHLLDAAYNGEGFERFELICNATEKLSFSASFAENTYLKVNQKNQWRAVVIDNKSQAKKNWIKCHQLSKIILN